MSAEERWADRAEWKNERDAVEIEELPEATTYEPLPCDYRGCDVASKTTFRIKSEATGRTLMEIRLCDDHASTDAAMHVYEIKTEE